MLTAIWALAWPTMLEQLMQTAVQYIDTAMVGSLGTQATAAVGSTGTVNRPVGSTISAMGVGFLSYISRARGADEPEKCAPRSRAGCFNDAVFGRPFHRADAIPERMVPV